MKTLTKIANWLRDSKGVATSLIEATATVAVGAVLAGVAVGGAIDAINNSKVQAAIGDVSAIGQGVITFYKDNAFFPLFADGQKTGGGDQFYGLLVSENGTYPTDTSFMTGSTTSWDIPTSPNSWPSTFTGFFGHQPNYTAGASGHASMEGHLIRNQLGAPVAAGTGASYPLRGAYIGDPQRGWAGPYITSLPKTDPWGDKYMINVRNLHAGYLRTFDGGSSSALPKLAVIVISAGPNRNIETRVDQSFDNFAAAGDDIVFRIK